jgi:protein TonB
MELRDDDDDEPTFLQRHRFAVGFIAFIAVLGAIVAIGIQILGNHGAPAKVSQVTMIKLLPPPPTPPPTPPPQVQPQPTVQQMIDQKQMMEPETKPEKPDQKRDEPPKAHDKAPGPLGLNAKGEGAGDAFGLVGKPGGNGLFGDGGGGGGSRWGWYAGEVQSRVEDALQKNSRTRSAALRLEVRIWPDTTGRITRAELVGSTGDAALDAAIKGEVLTGLQLQEPPPAGMPLPIVMRLTERRPN